MQKTNTVESVCSTPMPSLDSGWACVRRMRFKANGLSLRGLGVEIAQGDNETELVADLAGIDNRLLPAILATSEKRMSDTNGLRLAQGGDGERQREHNRLGRSADLKSTHLSCNKFNGHFDPGGNKDFSGLASSAGGGWLFFDEFPAFPDFTIPLRGGIPREERAEWRHVTDHGEPNSDRQEWFDSWNGLSSENVLALPALSVCPYCQCFPPTARSPLELSASASSVVPASSTWSWSRSCLLPPAAGPYRPPSVS